MFNLKLKYLVFILVLSSCKSETGKLAPHKLAKDITKFVLHDTAVNDMHDPYQTGKDTAYLNTVIGKILKIPEVKSVDNQIRKTSKGKHGVAFMVTDEYNSDTTYYLFSLGDNSHNDRYVNVFNFLLEKKTGYLKVYDPVSDSIISLKDWESK